MYWIPLAINGEPWRIGPMSSNRYNGKIVPTMGRDAQLSAYQDAIAEATIDWLTENGLMPADVLKFDANKLTVYFWRQLADYETDSGKRHRKHVVDATNLLKATEDALQGILFFNDKTNLDVRSVIAEQSATVTQPWVVIHLEHIDMLSTLAEEIPFSVLNVMSDQPALFSDTGSIENDFSVEDVF